MARIPRGEDVRGDPADAAEVSFSADVEGLTVVDHIEHQQFDLLTPAPVEPSPADPTHFWFPTDAATEIWTERIALQSPRPARPSGARCATRRSVTSFPTACGA